MNFTVTTRRGGQRRGSEGTTFTIDKLWAARDGAPSDVSHLVDRTYRYRSVRELQWHLADRFELPVQSVALQAA